VYVKDMSLEVPHAPQVFLEQAAPEVDMQLATESNQIDEGYYECTLTVTVTAKLPEKTLFLVEVAQAGIFQIRNVPESDLEPLLATACPNILFPYAREAVSDVVARAGFPPVYLAPVNFEALFAQQQQRLQQEAAPAPETVQ
jgi:preprotein translocase subunit SecB